MKNIKVIGHRGVRGIEVENTRKALKSAVELGVDAVEFDVRATADGHLVVCHNRNLKKIYGLDQNIDEIGFAEASGLKSANGEAIPTLDNIVKQDLKTQLLVELKNRGTAKQIYDVMNKSGQTWGVTTFLFDEARELRNIDSDLFISLASYVRPLRTIRRAKSINCNAVTMPLYLLNPLTYWYARKHKLKMMVYQNYAPWLLTTRWIVWTIRLLYPEIAIFTDRPDKIASVLKK